MEYLDQTHTDKGEQGIIAQLSDESMTGMVVLAVTYCRNHPQSTIYNASAMAYRITRTMEMRMGVAK